MGGRLDPKAVSYTHLDVYKRQAYLSVVEALAHAGGENRCRVNIRWVDAENVTPDTVNELLAGCQGVLVPGGFGYRGVEGMIIAVSYTHLYGESLRPYICDAGLYLDQAAASGKKILFEAQLGALRDIDFGIYPYTSSSSTIAAYAPIGAGVPNRRLDLVIGIMTVSYTHLLSGVMLFEMGWVTPTRSLLSVFQIPP